MQYNTLLKDKTLFGRTLLLAILAIITLILTACNSSSDDPAQVITDFYKALEKNDTDAAVELIYNPTSEGVSKSVLKSKLSILNYDGTLKKHKGLKNLKISEIKYSDDKKQASINITEEYNDCINLPYVLDVINYYGKWFISVKIFDKPSIMPNIPKNDLFYLSVYHCNNQNTQAVSSIDILFFAFNIILILLHFQSIKE